MLMPNGQPADNTDKIMLLAMWTNALRTEREKLKHPEISTITIISAGMGKPTFPINPDTIQAYLDYWQKVELREKIAKDATDEMKAQASIGYGDPQGDENPRVTMAQAMSNWYGTLIEPDNVLFTVGGAGALRVIFETFNLLYKDMPGYRVITPFPHYTLYADNKHLLHPIDVMKEPGYRLTARSIQSSIDKALTLSKKDSCYPKVILLCNPNNPLGTIILEDELIKIAELLRQYPELHIVLDEAYAEMSFVGKKIPSFLAIAPDLKPRVTILRSATKALSAAGERMAVLMAFDPALMGKFLDKNIGTIGHAPRSAQLAYAQTMAQFTEEAHHELAAFYQPKVRYVSARLQAMGAFMPDPDYDVDGTFYILADLSDLLGLELPTDAIRALGKVGLVKTNEDLAYYLLFNDSIMLAPGSYFGLSKKSGFMRITCSGGMDELCELMNRIESRLLAARLCNKMLLLDEVSAKLSRFQSLYGRNHAEITEIIACILQGETSCLGLKKQNQSLQEISNTLSVYIKRFGEEGRSQAATTIQSFFRRHLAYKEKLSFSDALDAEWGCFVNILVPQPCEMKAYFLKLSVAERLNFAPWKEHLMKGERIADITIKNHK